MFSECAASQPASQLPPKTEANFLRMRRVTAPRHSPRHNASPKLKQIISECAASQPASQRQPKTGADFLRMRRVTARVTAPAQNGSKFSQNAPRHSPRHNTSPKRKQIFSECAASQPASQHQPETGANFLRMHQLAAADAAEAAAAAPRN